MVDATELVWNESETEKMFVDLVLTRLSVFSLCTEGIVEEDS